MVHRLSNAAFERDDEPVSFVGIDRSLPWYHGQCRDSRHMVTRGSNPRLAFTATPGSSNPNDGGGQ